MHFPPILNGPPEVAHAYVSALWLGFTGNGVGVGVAVGVIRALPS